MFKQYAFISDIHGNIEALKSVLRDIENRNIPYENVYCLGDSVGYGTRPNEVLDLIRGLNIKSVLGNYDEAVGFFLHSCGCSITSNNDKLKNKNALKWTAEHTTDLNKAYIRQFEEQIIIKTMNKSILLTHASPISINDYIYEDDTKKQKEIAEGLNENIIVFGHTHLPYVKEVKNKLFVNAGSVGRPKDGDNRACYCVMTIGVNVEAEFVRVPYNIEKMAKEIEESELLDVFAKKLRTARETS